MDWSRNEEGQQLLWELDLMVQLRRTSWLTRQTKVPVLVVPGKGGYRNNSTLILHLLQLQTDANTQMKTSSTLSPLFPALTTESLGDWCTISQTGLTPNQFNSVVMSFQALSLSFFHTSLETSSFDQSNRMNTCPPPPQWAELAGKFTILEKVIKKKGRRAGQDKQREGNKQEPRGETSAQHSRQTRKAARQQRGDESGARAAQQKYTHGKERMQRKRDGARSMTLQK